MINNIHTIHCSFVQNVVSLQLSFYTSLYFVKCITMRYIYLGLSVTTDVLKLFMDHSMLLNAEKDTILYLQNI